MLIFKPYIKQLNAVFILTCFLIIGCKYDNEENLYPSNSCIISDMSFSNDIYPILQNYNCISCHNTINPQGGVNLEDYTQTKIWVDNSRLAKSINHNGASPMPKNQEKMDSCDIRKIESWISDGAQNN